MSSRNDEYGADETWNFKPHWVTLLRPSLFALVGVALYKFGRDFAESRVGSAEIGRILREVVEPSLGALGVKRLLEYAQPASIGAVVLLFGLPLFWALVVRGATILRVDSRQIIWQRGVFARAITQVEIGEVVGVNVYETFIGRIMGFGTVDIETRGEDRLVANTIANARGFAGLVLDFKHRLAAR
ncbi:MAG: PH domain-containing protein [Methylocystis sp.]